VSNKEGQSHCWINQNAKLSLGYFEKGREINYDFDPVNKCVFIFIIEGNVSVNKANLQERDAIGIWNTDSISIVPNSESHFLIVETPVNQK
jgi:redox-sensitive bicupin YhaK (pirin superfamily)